MKNTKSASVMYALCSTLGDVKKQDANFNLKDASVRGVEILNLNPLKWSELESEYLETGLNFSSSSHPANAGIQNR